MKRRVGVNQSTNFEESEQNFVIPLKNFVPIVEN